MNLLLAVVLAGTVAPAGLKGVVNAEKAKKLPAAAKAALVRDGFTVVAGAERHFFSLYDRNAYEKVPSFISTDVVLHVFHVRFDDEVASLERQVALPALKAFASQQLARALTTWPTHRALAQYHATALALLDPTAPLDPRVANVKDDAAKLVEAKGRGSVAGCPGELELSFFKPRGHYDRWDLHGYFRAVTFYAQCGLAMKGADLGRAVDVARLVDAAALKDLEKVLALQRFVSGPADDPGLETLSPHLASLPAWPAAVPPAALEALAQKLSALPAAKVPTLDARGPVFRLLGGSSTADAALVGPSTPLGVNGPPPSILPVLLALTSREPFPAGAGLSARWLEVLRTLLTKPEGQPPFASTDAWARRIQVAAAGSYTELRHDTLLYVKQPMVMAEGGDSAELPATKVGGYVEPRPDVYRALLVLTAELATRGSKSTELEAFLRFLVEVSELELANQPLPKAMDERLRTIGSELEHLSRVHGDSSPPQALVADVFTVAYPDGSSRVLHVATGDVDELWVVAPRAGKPVLMRGGAFSFYEFLAEPGERLNDSQWMERLFERPPARPAWAQPIAVPVKPVRAD
ncbi:MAG: DUF3160 domain-containing protein [Archangium sp.]|nr:DUF3160 domain-containing protein [Archangium sp.]